MEQHRRDRIPGEAEQDWTQDRGSSPAQSQAAEGPPCQAEGGRPGASRHSVPEENPSRPAWPSSTHVVLEAGPLDSPPSLTGLLGSHAGGAHSPFYSPPCRGSFFWPAGPLVPLPQKPHLAHPAAPVCSQGQLILQPGSSFLPNHFCCHSRQPGPTPPWVPKCQGVSLTSVPSCWNALPAASWHTSLGPFHRCHLGPEDFNLIGF